MQDNRYKLNGLRKGVVATGAALLGVALLGGCASIKAHRGYLIDQTLIDSAQPGVDNRMSVERTLGRPTFVSQFGTPTWYYVSIDTRQAPFARPKSVDQTILKVSFDKAGNVARIDRAGMEKVARLDPDGKKTATLGRDRSFLEDLFGNIGAVGAVPGGTGGAGGPGPNGS